MTTVQEATRIVLDNKSGFGEEALPLAMTVGRVLREEVFADRDFPPFHRVTMDGIAIPFSAFEKGQRTFYIEGLQAAGTPQLFLKNQENCFEVMTGAVLPGNTDTVIRYEDLDLKNGRADVLCEDIRQGQNIHFQGSDRTKGQVVIKPGCVISPSEIGVAATVGKSKLKVAKLPKVAIISTGDELVEIHDKPFAHQIRKSNAYSLAAAVSRWGIVADMLHLKDNRAEIEQKLRACMEEFDVLLLSGGVSAGKLDYVPEVLDELKVKKLFHKVEQRPGKPFWFGRADSGTVIFAFPGNPVSSFMCLFRYFQPWLRASLGLQPFIRQFAMLSEDFFFKPSLTYFLQVRISFEEDGSLLAIPAMGGGSGDLANLVDADAFLELPSEEQLFKKGATFPLVWYR